MQEIVVQELDLKRGNAAFRMRRVGLSVAVLAGGRGVVALRPGQSARGL